MTMKKHTTESSAKVENENQSSKKYCKLNPTIY